MACNRCNIPAKCALHHKKKTHETKGEKAEAVDPRSPSFHFRDLSKFGAGLRPVVDAKRSAVVLSTGEISPCCESLSHLFSRPRCFQSERNGCAMAVMQFALSGMFPRWAIYVGFMWGWIGSVWFWPLDAIFCCRLSLSNSFLTFLFDLVEIVMNFFYCISEASLIQWRNLLFIWRLIWIISIGLYLFCLI